jgi:tetratricopeptide (TPR) repeat protein
MMPSFGLPEELRAVDLALSEAPNDPQLRLRRAAALDALGQSLAARHAYIDVLRLDPANAEALNNLGTLLFNGGFRSAARLSYQELIKHHPGHVMGLVNLANAELEEGRLEEARRLYEAAITIEPDTALAHQGLSYALERLGDATGSSRHREIGFSLAPLVLTRYRGTSVPVEVLLLLSPARANVATELALDDTTFLVAKLFPEFYDEELPLPPHDVVFNAISDAERSLPALEAAERLIAKTGAAVINRPSRVAQTGRVDVARRLAGIEGVVVPRMAVVKREELGGLAMPFPFLLRSPGFHTGEHFELVPQAEDLAAAAERLPGNELLAIEFLDARGADGATRKYRVLFVDGKAYPLHLARATQWKVHYYSADLVGEPEAIAEETAFLTGMEQALGMRAFTALHAIRDVLALDYFGIDFALDRQGRLLVFEANATMKAVPPVASDPNQARHEAVRSALSAVRALVLRRAREASSE